MAGNQRRHNLSPLDLARFIKGRVVAGESNAVIARKLGMDLTTVAHHLALLDLPPPVDQALKADLCTSPRTLYELSKLHGEKPEQVSALIAGGDITRSSVAALKAPRSLAPPMQSRMHTELTKATFACALLEHSLNKINKSRGDFQYKEEGMLSANRAAPECLSEQFRTTRVRWHARHGTFPSSALEVRATISSRSSPQEK